MDEQDSLLDRIDNLVSGCNLIISDQKIIPSPHIPNMVEICLDLKHINGNPNVDLMLKDLIYFNQFYVRTNVYKKISDYEDYIYLKLQIPLPLPKREFYMLKPKLIQTHNFISLNQSYMYFGPIYSICYKCSDCDMIGLINEFNRTIIHSKFNLTCNEHTMKVVME